jgi:hypothetical protein
MIFAESANGDGRGRRGRKRWRPEDRTFLPLL